MKKQILIVVIILLTINLASMFSSCEKKNLKKISFEEYSTKLSTEKYCVIKQKLKNLGYSEFDFSIKDNFANIQIIHEDYYSYDDFSINKILKPKITFTSINGKNYITFDFLDGEDIIMCYKYYKDDLGNEYYQCKSEDEIYYYVISGEYLKNNDKYNYNEAEGDNYDYYIKPWKDWSDKELKFLEITQNELWATMSYYLNEKTDEKNKNP